MGKTRAIPTRTLILLGLLALILVATAVLTGFKGEARVPLLLLCFSVPVISWRVWRIMQARRGQ